MFDKKEDNSSNTPDVFRPAKGSAKVVIGHGVSINGEINFYAKSLKQTGFKNQKIKSIIKKEVINKNNELFLILKKARQEIASKNKIPAYIIFHDSTLQEISELMPTSKNEFLSINGIGESKLEKYYDIFSTHIID